MIAKARVAQLTGLPSMTAAAEGPVTFGCFFYRWKARLLSRWDSSAAQGTGGRVRTPAPTKYGKLSGLSVGAGPRPARGRPQGSPLRRKTGRDRWLGKLRRRNETAPLPMFLPLRPPVGPDGMAPKHSWFCAPEGIYLPLGVTPVMGVQGVGEYGRGASILSPPLGGSLVSFCPGRKKLAPQGEIPLRTTNAVRNPPPHPSGLRPATFPPGGRL